MAKLVIRTVGLPAEVIDLKWGKNRLGRSSGNDFQIFHDTLSRFHCEVELAEAGLFVRDLDSSNGTFVNDQPANNTQLLTGDILRLGDVSMEVKSAPEPVKETTAMCHIHPALPASMKCLQCHKVFCGACVHILKRTGGKVLRLCPDCSGHCEPIKLVVQPEKKSIANFVKRLFKKDAGETQPFHRSGD